MRPQLSELSPQRSQVTEGDIAYFTTLSFPQTQSMLELQDNTNMSQTGYFYAIGAAITWGVVYTIDQRILRNMSPSTLLFVDSLITAVLLLPVVLCDKGTESSLSGISGRTWLYIVASLCLAALANLFIFSSIKFVGASSASILEIAYPFFVVIFSFFVFQAVPDVSALIGGILIFTGTAIIFY